MIDYDPYAYQIHEDPYPTYARMREEAPLYHNAARGFFALSRHADVLAAFKDDARYGNSHGVSIDEGAWGPDAHLRLSFLGADPPVHTVLRGLVSRGFTPRRVLEMENRISEITVAYLDDLAGEEEFDFIDRLAGKVPMDVISELLGVPGPDRDELRRRADLLVHREEGEFGIPVAATEAYLWMRSYFEAMLKERRVKPQEDLLSALLKAEVEGKNLDEEEILAFANLMIVAGNETTTKLLANSVYWLSQNPDQRSLVVDDPSLLENWIEETLRYDNSTQMLARHANEDIEIHGETIPRGSQVLLLVGAANRDGRVFPNPDAYDLRRDTTDSLSFGRGIHFCLGASLARLEGRAVLSEWIKRHPRFEVRMDDAVRVHSINVRGFAKLPVRPAG